MTQKRLFYFDMAKGLGIILVVLGHIEYISEELRAWISSFHMPLFFIISGMIIYYKREIDQDLKDLTKKKFMMIMIPYISFTIIYTFIDILNLYLGKIDIARFIKNILAGITFYGSSVLWFLPALFLSEVGFIYITKKYKKITSIIIILIMALLAYFIQLVVSNYYSLNENSLLITTLIDFIRVFLRASIAMSFICVSYYTFHFFQDNESFSWKELFIGIIFFIANLFLSQINGCVDFHFIILENIALFYTCAFLGSFGLILICKNCKYFPQIGFFGRNSLIVMCTHVNCYILYASILIAWQIDTLVTRAKSYVFLFNIMIFTFLFEAIIILLINRFFPFILGRSQK